MTTTPSSVDAYQRLQLDAAMQDAVTLHQLGHRLQSTIGGGNAAQCAALARSVAAYALGIAARIESTAAYAAGAASQRRDDATLVIVTDAEAPAANPNRRKRSTGRRGNQPWEYRVGDDWLTTDEIAERSGMSYQVIAWRLRQGVPAQQLCGRRAAPVETLDQRSRAAS